MTFPPATAHQIWRAAGPESLASNGPGGTTVRNPPDLADRSNIRRSEWFQYRPREPAAVGGAGPMPLDGPAFPAGNPDRENPPIAATAAAVAAGLEAPRPALSCG